MEESSTNCNEEPLVTDETPKEGSKLFVLPYEEVKFNVSFMSQLERFVTSFEYQQCECEIPFLWSAPRNSHGENGNDVVITAVWLTL